MTHAEVNAWRRGLYRERVRPCAHSPFLIFAYRLMSVGFLAFAVPALLTIAWRLVVWFGSLIR